MMQQTKMVTIICSSRIVPLDTVMARLEYDSVDFTSFQHCKLWDLLYRGCSHLYVKETLENNRRQTWWTCYAVSTEYIILCDDDTLLIWSRLETCSFQTASSNGWSCAPGLRFQYCRCQFVGYMSYSRLLVLRAATSRVLRHVKQPRCGEVSTKPRALI